MKTSQNSLPLRVCQIKNRLHANDLFLTELIIRTTAPKCQLRIAFLRFSHCENLLQKSHWRLQDRYNLMWEVTKCHQRAKWNTPTQNKWHQSMFRCYQCPVLYDFLIFHVHIQKSPLCWSTTTQRPNGHKPNFAYVL